MAEPPPLYNDCEQARKHDIGECSEPYRTEFRRDYARLIHSPSFRRLQGKTQLFPGFESDFFRNRLTHSIEVAQIGKTIANKINYEKEGELQGAQIDTDLVEFAALAHDLGHPPFGHNGEAALNDLMRGHGGFEGNAQTLRILTKIEKKHSDKPLTDENRAGLNLTFRSLASVLKYDNEISKEPKGPGLDKGYYSSERGIVDEIKRRVSNNRISFDEFKTIECHIMDIADDIAYSTYDLEDALQSGFMRPMDFLVPDDNMLKKIADKVFSKIGGNPDMKKVADHLTSVFEEHNLFESILEDVDTEGFKAGNPYYLQYLMIAMKNSVDKFRNSSTYRSELTSSLISRAIDNVDFDYNDEFPALSKATIRREYLEKIECLKQYAFCSLIESPRLKVAEYRGKEIVDKIFEVLRKQKPKDEKADHLLLPDDYKNSYKAADDTGKERIICDFIAGMTDRYAIEFYGRLKSENPQTIFKPL